MAARFGVLLSLVLASLFGVGSIPTSGITTAAFAQVEQSPPLDVGQEDSESLADGDEAAGPIRVTGRIIDLAGKPIRGAQISLIRGEGRRATTRTAKSDGKGRWAVIGLWPGRWNLRVEEIGRAHV